MGDNGLAFPSGKGCLHDPGLTVPLICWWPGVIKPGSESHVLVSGEDIAPTCLEVAGLKVPERISGVSFLPALKGEPFAKERKYVFGQRGPHGGATFDEHTTSSGVDYSRCVRSGHYKLIYNVTPNIRYTPVDSAANPSWKDMTKAHEQQQLASEFETLYFTSPRPVYERDLDADPDELHNLYGEKKTTLVLHELKTAMQEKMILDYDYLPLPIPANPKRPRKKSAKIDPKREILFDRLDTNHDGRLSMEEFSVERRPEEAEAWFKARDLDHDGYLSREDLILGAESTAFREKGKPAEMIQFGRQQVRLLMSAYSQRSLQHLI